MSSKTSECWTSGPRRIQLSVTASRIGEIDTQDESFTARLWIDAWWLPSPKELETQVSEWEVLPNFQLTNASEVSTERFVNKPTLVEKSGATHWKATIELVGKFRPVARSDGVLWLPPQASILLYWLPPPTPRQAAGQCLALLISTAYLRPHTLIVMADATPQADLGSASVPPRLPRIAGVP